MIKVFLENGDIIECQDNISGIVSIISAAKTAKNNTFFELVKTDGNGVVIPADRILWIEGPIKEVPDSEVETGPYSEDINIE